jgi:hypothetical protein
MRTLLLSTIFIFFLTLASSAQTLLDTAINFTVKDTYGNTIELFDLLNAGKIVAIDFFSTT